MCTCFAVYHNENPIYGMNFDADEIPLNLSLNHINGTDVFYYQGYMNDECINIAGINSNGLFICNQALEFGNDFKPCSNENRIHTFDVIKEVMPKGEKASDFLDTLGERSAIYDINPIFPTMGVHTMIVDQYGGGFILEEGTYTNVITPKKGECIVMTNFPVGNFANKRFDEVCGCGADRYIQAYNRINERFTHFGVNDAFEVLKSTRQDMTLCSIVFEPLKQEAYIYFKLDFEKKWKISLREKTIYSLDGLNHSNCLKFGEEGVNVKELYQFY